MRTLTQRIVRDEIGKDFDVSKKVLGTGYSGAVLLAVQRDCKRQVAVKQFSKRRLKPSRLKLLQSEVEVYLRLDHPNVCRLLHVYEGKSDVWLVMELCGCELYGRLCRQKVYTEGDAADVMLQMLQAIKYLHSHNIVHRDLKLENWMYGESLEPMATPRDGEDVARATSSHRGVGPVGGSHGGSLGGSLLQGSLLGGGSLGDASLNGPGRHRRADGDDRLKLIDFGFSRILGCADETLDMPCGTLHYTSPEVLLRKYTSKCDIWALGVIGYMLLNGRPPFRGSANSKLAKAILNADYPRDGRWTALSGNAHDFLDQLLRKDASRRPDATQALSHPWLAEAMSSSGLGKPRGDIGIDVLRSLKQFAQGSHLRRVALTLLAYGLTSGELQDLEKTFLDFDRTGCGTIRMEQLAEVLSEYCKASEHPELSTSEVRRIFDSLDVSREEEVHYTSFVAAMLASRVRLHEDKIRAAFDAFDREGSGFITADALVQIFAENGDSSGKSVACTGTGMSTSSSCGTGLSSAADGGFSRADAEQWIREVDYKGNGVIDYDGFLAALMGKRLWAPLLEEDRPTVRVFEASDTDGRPRGRGFSDSLIRHGLASAIIDNAVGDLPEGRVRAQSEAQGAADYSVKLRNVTCDVDERYFC